jgi:hypothetical protein
VLVRSTIEVLEERIKIQKLEFDTSKARLISLSLSAEEENK